MSAAPVLFPAFLKVTGRTILVVGAGGIAEKKIAELLEAGATVRVVAPRATAAVDAWAREGRIVLAKRPVVAADVDGAWLVVAATDSPEAQALVYEAAEARSTFVIAIDDPAHGSAFCGAIVRKAPFLVAISSSGQAPALARLLREMLDAFLPEATWVERATALRARWKAEKVPMEGRFPWLVRAFAEGAKLWPSAPPVDAEAKEVA